MSETLWCGVVPSISEREGIDVTATVKRTGGGVEIAYSFDDPEQRDVEDECWDAETAAAIAEQLSLVKTALYASEALSDARERWGVEWSHRVRGNTPKDTGAQLAVEQAQVAYDKAMAALPKVLP